MKKIKVYVSNGLVGCRKESIIEVEDDLEEGDIDDVARDEMFNMIEWGWEIVDSPKSR